MKYAYLCIFSYSPSLLLTLSSSRYSNRIPTCNCIVIRTLATARVLDNKTGGV